MLSELAADVGLVEGEVSLLGELRIGVVEEVRGLLLLAGFEENIDLIMPLDGIKWEFFSEAG